MSSRNGTSSSFDWSDLVIPPPLILGISLGVLAIILNRLVRNYLIGGNGHVLGRAIKPCDSVSKLVPTAFGNTRVVTLGSGPLVVLMHGFAGSAEVFMDPFRSNLSSALVARGYSILMYDFFGHGHSDSPDIAYAAELFASQLADICLFLNIKGPFHILAHSMGASVAARFLAVHPQMVDRVILLSPSVADYPLEVRLRFALRVPILGEILASVIIPRLGEGVNMDNPGITRACWRLLRTRLYSGGSWNAGPAKSLRNLEGLALAPTHVLVLWGLKDRVVPFAEAKVLAQVLPRALMSVHPEADHMGFADGPEEMRHFFQEEILAFLRDDVQHFDSLQRVVAQNGPAVASATGTAPYEALADG